MNAHKNNCAIVDTIKFGKGLLIRRNKSFYGYRLSGILLTTVSPFLPFYFQKALPLVYRSLPSAGARAVRQPCKVAW